MEGKFKHVINSGNKWAVKEEGSESFSYVYDTKEEAVFRAREIAKHEKTDFFVHTQQGKIEFSSSFSNESQMGMM